MPDVTPRFKEPKQPAKKRAGVKAQRAGTAAAYKRKATRLWGAVIHARDAGCQRCGRTEGKLEAHHILPREFCATRTDEGNGVLLCYRCHKGRDGMHCDPMAAVGFYLDLLGEDGYTALRAKAKAGVNQKFPAAFWKSEVERLSALLERYGA